MEPHVCSPRRSRVSSVATCLTFLILVPWAVVAAKEPADPNLPSSGPLPGQIIRDPEHPQWLMRAGGQHVFICGPGDPEGFLYHGPRRADGTRDGQQVQMIRKLIEHGGNCIYLQTLRGYDVNGDGRSDGGGDGTADHNPFIDGDYRLGIDAAILDEWETWFTLMDDAGILIYLFIYDDGDGPWPYRPGAVDPGERDYVETIVNRFKHHENLIWVVGEEHDDADRVNDIAAIIAEADEFDHLVGNHHNSSIEFKTRDDTVMNHHAMQFQADTDEVHEAAIKARRLAEEAGPAGDGFMVIYSESTGSQGNNVDDTRHYNWNIATAGVMPMRLGMMIYDTPPERSNSAASCSGSSSGRTFMPWPTTMNWPMPARATSWQATVTATSPTPTASTARVPNAWGSRTCNRGCTTSVGSIASRERR